MKLCVAFLSDRWSGLCWLLLCLLLSPPLVAEGVNPSLMPSVNQESTNQDSTNQATLSPEEREFLQRKGRVKMCVDPEWLPLEKIEGGVHIGIAADYMAIMQDFLTIPIELVPVKSWTQSVELAKARRCDIFSLAMPTPERLEYMQFTPPYLRFPLVLASRSRVITSYSIHYTKLYEGSCSSRRRRPPPASPSSIPSTR